MVFSREGNMSIMKKLIWGLILVFYLGTFSACAALSAQQQQNNKRDVYGIDANGRDIHGRDANMRELLGGD